MRVPICPRWPPITAQQPPPEEHKAIVGGSLTHFGTVSVNPAEKTLTLNVEASTFPNWKGTALKVPFTITGDELTFTAGAAAASGGGTVTVVWKRAT